MDEPFFHPELKREMEKLLFKPFYFTIKFIQHNDGQTITPQINNVSPLSYEQEIKFQQNVLEALMKHDK